MTLHSSHLCLILLFSKAVTVILCSWLEIQLTFGPEWPLTIFHLFISYHWQLVGLTIDVTLSSWFIQLTPDPNIFTVYHWQLVLFWAAGFIKLTLDPDDPFTCLPAAVFQVVEVILYWWFDIKLTLDLIWPLFHLPLFTTCLFSNSAI